jgi:hypothetical protein
MTEATTTLTRAGTEDVSTRAPDPQPTGTQTSVIVGAWPTSESTITILRKVAFPIPVGRDRPLMFRVVGCLPRAEITSERHRSEGQASDKPQGTKPRAPLRPRPQGYQRMANRRLASWSAMQAPRSWRCCRDDRGRCTWGAGQWHGRGGAPELPSQSRETRGGLAGRRRVGEQILCSGRLGLMVPPHRLAAPEWPDRARRSR